MFIVKENRTFDQVWEQNVVGDPTLAGLGCHVTVATGGAKVEDVTLPQPPGPGRPLALWDNFD